MCSSSVGFKEGSTECKTAQDEEKGEQKLFLLSAPQAQLMIKLCVVLQPASRTGKVHLFTLPKKL